MENNLKHLNEDILQDVTGGKLDTFSTAVLALFVKDCKSNGFTLDETIKIFSDKIHTRSAEFYEAIEHMNTLWNDR